MFAAPFHLGDRPPRADGADAYGRTEHPTLRVLEEAIGDLDGGRCLAFATGMAAISAAVLACAGAGDTVLLPSDGYYTTRILADAELDRLGLRIEYVPTLEIEALAARGGLDGVRLVLLETPSNPQLDVCDIAAVARAARAAGALLAVDNTTATPIGQQPLALGADLTVGSDTKALTGHSDLLLGHVAPGTTPCTTGCAPGATPPAERRGRSRRGSGTARWARWTCGWPARPRTRRRSPRCSPRTPPSAGRGGRGGRRTRRSSSRPGRCCGANGVVSAEFADAAAVLRFLGATRLWVAATSFGGVHSTADRRAQWGATRCRPGFVRFSCGIEDTADLVADLEAGLAAL